METIWQEPAWALVARIRKKEISPLEVMTAALERIEAANPALNAFVDLYPEKALTEARVVTERIASGANVGPLSGLPMGGKDLEDVAGMITSYGSIPFRDNRALNDSIQVARLKAAGAIVVGKTNTPEFGFTGFTKNRLHGVTRNPWNPDRTPGGSSGGSAAAVAGGLVPFCTGSDAGGSIRIPASYSGCFGFKPTFGRIPLGPSSHVSLSAMTVLGPLTRSVRDAALYLDCTMGCHPADPYSLPAPATSYQACLTEPLKPLKIAYSPDLGYAVVQNSIAACTQSAAKVFEEMGHHVEVWSGGFPDTGEYWSAMIAADIVAQLGEVLDRERAELSRTLVSVLEQTRHMTVEQLSGIQQVRARLNDHLEALFDEYDLLLTPTMPTEAFDAGGPPPSEIEGRPIPLLGAVAFTYPFNFSGHPAASVPAGLTPDKLPAGLQIIAPRHRDDLVLQAAHAYEKAHPWDRQWPEV